MAQFWKTKSFLSAKLTSILFILIEGVQSQWYYAAGSSIAVTSGASNYPIGLSEGIVKTVSGSTVTYRLTVTDSYGYYYVVNVPVTSGSSFGSITSSINTYKCPGSKFVETDHQTAHTMT